MPDSTVAVKETDLAAAVVAYLRDLEWDVHQEVGGAYGSRADIVAVRESLLIVVETKTTLGLSVIEQAHGWLGDAHLIYVATPRGRRQAPERICAERILRDWGIGLLQVDLARWGGEPRVDEEIAPRMWRRIRADRELRLRGMLCDGTRTFASAGNNEGKFWSPFKATVQEIQRVVKAKQGIPTRELIREIQHHYASPSSASSALLKWLRLGKIPGVRGEGDNPIRWYAE